MKATKRLMTWLLVLAMVFTMLPMPVRAEETVPETAPETVPETVEETVPEAEVQAAPEAEPDALPKTERVTAVIPFQVNPLYEGVVSEDDFDIPEFSGFDPEQVETQAITYQTVQKAGETIRSKMKSRTESFTVYVKNSTSNYTDLGNDMMEVALEHTGKPTEGDYLMWQYGGYKAQVTREYDESSEMYLFTYEFVFTYYTTANQEKKVTSAVYSLLKNKGIYYMSDYDKICAVYDWICENVTYDYANLEDTSYKLKHTAYAAMIDKTAVCQGYALLFYRMMLELGIDCRLIAGLSAAEDGTMVAHGWNIVQLGDYYYSVDSTWDAGADEYSFFLTNTWNFHNHYRYLDYETWEFHEEYPMAAENYDPEGTAEIDPYIYLGMCGNEAFWLLYRDGTLEISGNGSIADVYWGVASKRPEWGTWVKHITSVVIDEGITRVGDELFRLTENLEEVTLPSTVTSIGREAFYCCRKLKTVNFSEGLREIGNSAFWSCAALENIKLPSTLTTIETRAFTNCDSLTEISITSKITSLGMEAFSGCDSLHTVNLDIPTIPSSVFRSCGSLANINLSGNVKTIQDNAFEDCDRLKVLNIPGSVESVCGFRDCDGLTTVNLGEGTILIADNAFLNCSALTGITIPGTVTKLGTSCFENCDSIREVTIPETVTGISSSFKDCDGLVSANIYCDSVTGHAFESCDALTKIVLGGGVKTVGTYAFAGCTALTKIVLEDGVKTVEPYAFDNCDGLTDVEIAGTVESVSGFSNCDKLCNVTLGEGLKEIGEYAFQNCPALMKIEFPESLEIIHPFAFENCDGLTEITVTEGIKSLSGFSKCDNLTTVHFSEGLEKLSKFAFQNCGALTDVKLPESLLYIQKGAFSNCDQITEIELPKNLLTLSGFAGCDNLSRIEIPDSVREIGESAFTECKALTEVDFPAGLKTIGKSAFKSCAGLTEINFPDGLESINEDAFYGCSGLTEVTIPASVTYLSGFRSCANLETATIYSSGTLGSYAFSHCGKLHNLYILGDITKMESEVFRYCNSLYQITLPASLATKGDFMNCPSLQTAVINGTSKLEGYIFSKCSSLRNVVINGDVTDIGVAAFDRSGIRHLTFKGDVKNIRSMGNFETVTFLGDAPQISSYAFNGISTTMYYPSGNSTWDSVVQKTYGGSVTWIPIGTPERLELVNTPTVTSYVAGDALNLDGILLKAYYADGLERDVHMCDLDVVSCDMNTVGQTNVTVSCQGITATFPIYIHADGNTVKLNPDTYPAVTAGSLTDYEQNVQTISYPGASYLILVFNSASDTDSINTNMFIFNQNDEKVLSYAGTDIAGTIVTVPGDTAKICLNAGYYPKRCGYSFDAIYAVTPIHAGSSGTITVPPTCTEEGHATDVVCDICGIELEDQVLPVIDHDYTGVVTEPTCQAQGFTTYTCTMCEDSYVGDYTDPVDHSYENDTCIWCGDEVYTTQWISATTSLNGTIDLNIYVALSDNILNDPDAYVRFIRNGEIVDVPVSKGIESEKRGQVCYRYSCEIFAKQVADTVTIQVMNSKGAISDALEYSVMRYCVNQIKNSKDAELVKLCKALLNYATAAQVYFNHNTDNLANASLSEADKALPGVDASAYKFNVVGSEPGIKPRSATLMLEAEVAIVCTSSWKRATTSPTSPLPSMAWKSPFSRTKRATTLSPMVSPPRSWTICTSSLWAA